MAAMSAVHPMQTLNPPLLNCHLLVIVPSERCMTVSSASRLIARAAMRSNWRGRPLSHATTHFDERHSVECGQMVQRANSGTPVLGTLGGL